MNIRYRTNNVVEIKLEEQAESEAECCQSYLDTDRNRARVLITEGCITHTQSERLEIDIKTRLPGHDTHVLLVVLTSVTNLLAA